MIWFLLPVASAVGAAGGWWITKETATDVLEANQTNTPLVNVGTQTSTANSSNTLLVIGIVVLVWYFFFRKGK